MNQNNARSKREGTETFQVHRDGFRILGIESAKARAALDALLPDPDAITDGGTIYKQGSRNHSVRVDLSGQAFFLKRYNCRGFLYSLGNAFRCSRAVRTWLVNLKFQDLGLPVQEPLLCLEERRFRFLKRSYLLSGFYENSQSLMEVWPQLAESEKDALLRKLGTVLGSLHRHGGIHGDLKWYNILVRRGEEGLDPVIVDLDGSRFCRSAQRPKAQGDVGRFLRDLESAEKNSNLRALFLETWEQTFQGA